jgi:NAD(P)-dependent dehydrogenase (short-subunit alcohol dehydrogenase family)
MPIPRYTYTGPVDHTVKPDLSQVKGKSVIVTGGANGMGEAMVRSFVAAGAFVTIADMHPRGTDLAKELNSSAGEEVAVFVKCDIRSWEDQIKLFETAKAKSPSNSIDVVIANAGISRSSGDSLWNLDGKIHFCISSAEFGMRKWLQKIQRSTNIVVTMSRHAH